MYSTYRHVSYILLNEYIDGWCKYIYFNFRAYAMYKAEKKVYPCLWKIRQNPSSSDKSGLRFLLTKRRSGFFRFVGQVFWPIELEHIIKLSKLVEYIYFK